MVWALVILGMGNLSPSQVPSPIALFDGKTLNGWRVSSETGHGTGGSWTVENGAIIGTQDRPANGGILITEGQWGDFEVELEMNNDYGPDSGLFLRSNMHGQAYQAMIDYRNYGNLMGIFGEGIGGFIVRNFGTSGAPDRIWRIDHPAFPLPISPEEWPSFWKHGTWNRLKARIVGNPPHITTWINGVMFMDWTDTERRLPDTGGIALQVHGGGNTVGKFVRYRNIRVTPLPSAAAESGALRPVLQARYDEWSKAYVAGDARVLIAMLAPDFRLETGSGSTMSRADYTRSLLNRKAVPGMTYKTTIKSVSRNGNRATVITIEEVGQGGDTKIHYYRDEWTLRRGVWLLSTSKTLGEG